MAEPFIGEIRIFAGTFAPDGWFFCQGQLLAISQYDTLYNLIGTTYGGDGQQTFALPNLASKVPVHQGTGQSTYPMGSSGGVESVTLTGPQIPVHKHGLMATNNSATAAGPGGNVLAAPSSSFYASGQSANINLAGQSVMVQGQNQSHDNMIPFLGLNFIIAWAGMYPTQG